MLEGDKSLFELKTKAQMAISNLNKAGSMAFKSDFTVCFFFFIQCFSCTPHLVELFVDGEEGS